MQHRQLGATELKVSRLSFGGSSLGGVFRQVDEAEAIRAVHAAVDGGINYFDVAPAYGGGRSEIVLGKALASLPRDKFLLSTKVGKYTSPTSYGEDVFDYSAERIRRSIDDSCRTLGVEDLDIVYLHDIEYNGGQHTDWALGEGLETLHKLKGEGRLGAVGGGFYPIALWHRVIADCDIDVGMTHNHYCLNDTQLTDLLPAAEGRGVGLVNASPFASGLLTDRGPADWHPASPEHRALFCSAAEHCRQQGANISQLALRFSVDHPQIATTMFSSASPASVRRNLEWIQSPLDATLVAEVQAILAPLSNREWDY